MCDACSEPSGGRRCPSQRGARRRAYQRALYAARNAARAGADVGDSNTAPAPISSVPSELEIQDAIAATDRTWKRVEASQPDDVATAVFAYEEAVRRTGELVAAQVDDEIHRYLGEFDDAAWITSNREWLADSAVLQTDQREFIAWQNASIARLRRSGDRTVIEQFVREEEAGIAALNARAQELTKRRRALDDEMSDRGAAEGQVAADVLSRYRPYGTHEPAVHDRTGARPRALLTEASKSFPNAWMAASDSQDRMIVKETAGRAHYSAKAEQSYTVHHDHSYDVPPYGDGTRRKAELPPKPAAAPQQAALDNGLGYGSFTWAAVRDSGTGQWHWRLRESRKHTEYLPELLVPTKDQGSGRARSTTIHELSHRIETHDLRIPYACKTFRHRRTMNPDGTARTLEQYAPGEFVHPDKFVSAYVGKEYKGTNHSEVLSMGMEAVFAGTQGGLVGRQGHLADPEHRHLILGLCASI